MMKMSVWCSLLLGGFAITGVGIDMNRVAVPPRLDGKLDDPCWKNIPSITDFKEEGTTTSDGTWAKLAYDDAYLYLAFSCPHAHPDRMKADDDGVTYKVHYDEHVALAISPDPAGQRLFNAQINPRGVTQVIDYNKFGKDSWDYGSFCRAAPAITATGWNLEIAIPWLRICTKKGFDKDKLAINLARALLANKIDAYGVFAGYETRKSFLSLDKPENPLSKYAYRLLPARFKDAPPTLKEPFAMAIVQAKVTDYVYRDGKCYYGVDFTLEGFSGERGKVAIYIDDPLSPETMTKPTLRMTLGQSNPTLSASVECRSFTPRDLKLRVVDANGDTIADRVILSPAIFNALNARLDRDYYTNEKNANVIYQCHLPAELAGKMGLSVMVDGGRERVVNVAGLSRNGAFALDITALPLGEHKARVICDIAGQNVYDKEFALIKKAPSKVLEVKLDNARRGLLVSGKPFFPFGVLTHSEDEEDLRLLAEHGVNTVSPWFVRGVSAEGYKTNIEANLAFVKKAAKYNIYVMPNLDTLGTSAAGLPSLSKFFPADKQKLIAEQAKDMTEQRMKGAFACGGSDWYDLPRFQKNQLFEELYQKTVPYYRLAVERFRECPNVIGYFFYDEPTLGAFDMNVQGKKLHGLIKQVDGYRPTWTLYSSYIPAGVGATDWIDCLGTDPYWTAPVTNPEGNDRNSVSFVSHITAMNKKRADDANGMCWSIPMIENWCGSYKRFPLPEEFRCQSYLALIHGAKGLIYFVYPVASEQSMNSLLRVGNEVKALTPWLLTKDIPQTPTAVNAALQHMVRVNDRGEYVTLAANSRPWPVKFTMGFPKAIVNDKDAIKEFFTGETFKIENGAFSDTLAPFAAKVYNLGKSVTPLAEIKVDLKVAEQKNDWRPEVVYTPDGRPGKRNILPNPSFEEAGVPGIPDYYFSGRKDPYPAWGSPNSPWTLDAKEAYHGKQSLRIRTDKFAPERNFFYVAQLIAPKHSKATKYTLSAYMKSDRDNAVVNMGYKGGGGGTYKIGKEWKRYRCAVTVPANSGLGVFWIINPRTEGSTIWVDAAQMELGDKLTDFEE